jgi:hypothetical protein
MVKCGRAEQATNTCSEYVVLIIFSLQHWLHYISLPVLFVCDNVGELSSHCLLHVAVKAKSPTRYMFYFSDGHTAGIEGQMSVDPELFKTIVR